MTATTGQEIRQDTVSDAEWAAREDLAAYFRLIAREGMDELFQTHMGARVPDEEGTFLINPYGVLFSQIRASDLVKVNYAGDILTETSHPINPASVIIHEGILEARPDVACTIHLHTHAGVAVSTHREGLMPLNQRALYFQPILAYHDYEGLALDEDEKKTLSRDLSDKWLMILRNHGTIAAGRTIAQAYVYAYYLERACIYQIMTLSGGVPLTELDQETIDHVAEQAVHIEHMGKYEWPALRALLDKEERSYKL